MTEQSGGNNLAPLNNGSGTSTKCTLPFWLIITLTTVFSVLLPVMVGLFLVEDNSNDVLGDTQLGSISANASGLSQLILERITAAEGVAYYIASHVKLAQHSVDYQSQNFYKLLSQALFSFNVFVK